MKGLGLLITVLLVAIPFTSSLAVGDTNFTQVKASFTEAVEAEIQKAQAQELSLSTNYASYLEGQEANYQLAGKLDTVLWLKQEQASLREGSDLPELTVKANEEMKALRKKYMDARQKIMDQQTVNVRGLYDRYADYLEKQVSQLTRSGKIDEAQQVQDELMRCRAMKPKDPGFDKIIRDADRLFFFAKMTMKDASFASFVDVTDYNNRIHQTLKPTLNGNVTVEEKNTFNFKNGRVTYTEPEAKFSAGIIHAGALSMVIEFEAAEANLESFGCMFSLSNAEGVVDFALGQEGSRLVLFLKTSENEKEFIDLGEIQEKGRSRILIEYKPHSLLAYRDEKRLKTTELRGDFRNWDLTDVVLGNVADGSKPWSGVIRGFLLENHINERRSPSSRARMLGSYE